MARSRDGVSHSRPAGTSVRDVAAGRLILRLALGAQRTLLVSLLAVAGCAALGVAGLGRVGVPDLSSSYGRSISSLAAALALESFAAATMARVRLANVALVLLPSGACAWLLLHLQGLGAAMALRNLLGYTGATLVGVVLVGGQLGWSLRLVPVLLLTPWTQRPDGSYRPFGWYLEDVGSGEAGPIAVSLSWPGSPYMSVGDRVLRQRGE